jgi:hypothetical protein
MRESRSCQITRRVWRRNCELISLVQQPEAVEEAAGGRCEVVW